MTRQDEIQQPYIPRYRTGYDIARIHEKLGNDSVDKHIEWLQSEIDALQGA